MHVYYTYTYASNMFCIFDAILHLSKLTQFTGHLILQYNVYQLLRSKSFSLTQKPNAYY